MKDKSLDFLEEKVLHWGDEGQIFGFFGEKSPSSEV